MKNSGNIIVPFLGFILAVSPVASAWPWDEVRKAKAAQEEKAEHPREESVEKKQAIPMDPPGQARGTLVAAGGGGGGGEEEETVAATEEEALEEAVKQKAQIQKAQSEIDAIIEMNQTVRSLHKDRIAEIQRIHEQALIHQKLLKDLQAAAKANSDIQNLLRREKVRLIQKETEKNRQLMETLKTTKYTQ